MWTMTQMRSFLSSRRTLVCGAEAAVQQQLFNEPEYMALASEYWPASACIEFVQPPDDGRFLSENLDIIKKLLLDRIKNRSYDTVFLCLGGAAKILCFEIAEQVGVCAIDWGSMLRALTYSGSDGFANWRASHNPFFFRVPLRLYFPALAKAHPGKSPEWYLGKVHSQLALNLQLREKGRSRPADAHDQSSRAYSHENMRDFEEDYLYYESSIIPRFRQSRKLVSDFHNWLLRNRVPVRVRSAWRIRYYADRVRRRLLRWT
jgi:hypothetical protein